MIDVHTLVPPAVMGFAYGLAHLIERRGRQPGRAVMRGVIWFAGFFVVFALMDLANPWLEPAIDAHFPQLPDMLWQIGLVGMIALFVHGIIRQTPGRR